MTDDDTTIGDAWSVERHLEGKPELSVAMFRRFVELVAACGPYEVSTSKSSVTFKGTRRGFAGARPTASGLAVYLDLQRALESPRVRNVSPYTSRLFVHHLTLQSLEELDDELAGWIAEAYDVGAGAHLRDDRRG
ncbi:hypothetical protein SAMN04487783_1595 [Agrococcus baldri]|uniref:DUF5655 domain-containing protein n=1 Tax=Agrococcus baldri TaxID=153730 RepID=A0AA94HMZ6_9MICO|nr:DUF5655 domain-containing protein [Agrococcus baldri]SFS11566.1 hypothetical protein SAMN04487783_1595 [Agrococcus baldri]